MSISRLALPQDNLIQKSISSENQMAGELFGKDNLKADHTKMIAGSPLALFCKDSKRKEFFGDTIEGLDFAFCNKSNVIQTDVGSCIATNPIQFFENGKISSKNGITYIEEGLKDIEHVIVLLVDKSEFVNNPPNYKVS